MREIKQVHSANLIPIDMFSICLLDMTDKKDIITMFPTRADGAYYLDKFKNYLLSKGVDLKDYCKTYLNINWPTCPISGEEVGYRLTGKGVVLSTFKKGKISKKHCPNFAKACERFSIERTGSGNPMYKKKPWNKGLSSETDSRMKIVSEKRTGFIASAETREKLRLARKLSPLKARHTTPHSAETIKKLRSNTSKMWAEGVFSRKTSIEKIVENFLLSLSLKEEPVFQYQIDYYSVDFAFPKSKIAIECNGTFFHVDPRIYPNGPICAIQRRNFGRDVAKKKWVVDKKGWFMLELWETEINDGTFKDILKCKLLELNLLDR